MRLTIVLVSTIALLSGCQSQSSSSEVDLGLPASVKEKSADETSTNLAQDAGSQIEDPDAEDEAFPTVIPDVTKADENFKPPVIKASKPDEKTKTASLKKPKSGIVISSYRPPKVGTVLSYKNNWKSLEPKTVYKVVSNKSDFRGKPALALKSIQGTGNSSTTFHDPKTFGLLGYKDKKGNSVITYTSVEQRLKFPMRPGDKWVSQWESYEHATKKTTKGGGVVKVIGPEKLAVGAGRFKAMKIELPLPSNVGPGMKHYIWYSPSLGVIIREQISNNKFSWSKELESVKRPS